MYPLGLCGFHMENSPGWECVYQLSVLKTELWLHGDRISVPVLMGALTACKRKGSYSHGIPCNTMWSSVWLVACLVCPPSWGFPVAGIALVCGARERIDASDTGFHSEGARVFHLLCLELGQPQSCTRQRHDTGVELRAIRQRTGTFPKDVKLFR